MENNNINLLKMRIDLSAIPEDIIPIIAKYLLEFDITYKFNKICILSLRSDERLQHRLACSEQAVGMDPFFYSLLRLHRSHMNILLLPPRSALQTPGIQRRPRIISQPSRSRRHL
jgi:hypothetical protein